MRSSQKKKSFIYADIYFNIYTQHTYYADRNSGWLNITIDFSINLRFCENLELGQIASSSGANDEIYMCKRKYVTHPGIYKTLVSTIKTSVTNSTQLCVTAVVSTNRPIFYRDRSQLKVKVRTSLYVYVCMCRLNFKCRIE